jgi:hypothetical protein
MKKLTDFKYLFLSFYILMKAAEAYKPNDFESWIYHKSFFNRKLNRLAIQYFSKLNIPNSQILNKLLSLSILQRNQYRIRSNFFFNFQKIKSKKFKIFLCIIMTYLSVFRSLSKNFLSIIFLYDCISKKDVGKKIILTIGFPSHAFNYKSLSNSDVISSFGEYVYDLEKKDSKFRIVSVDEYVRKSKKNEQYLFNEEHHESISQNKRYSPKRKFSFYFFFIALFKAIKLWKSESRKFTITSLIEFTAEIRMLPYLDLIENISKDNQIIKIFIMPFSEFDFLRKYEFIKDKIYIFYYSDNYLIPPISQLKSTRFKFNDLNISVLGGFSNIFGFTENMNYLYDFISVSFGVERKTLPTLKEFPCTIGYERLFNLKGKRSKFSIALFDVPPETLEMQLASSVVGNMTSDVDFVFEFLNDTMNLADKLNLRVLLKPKYSLSNQRCEIKYKETIDIMINKFRNNLEVVDPYARLADIIDNSDLIISFPFTSVQKFSRIRGKQSYFYIPTKYKDYFLEFGDRNDCLYGSKEFENILVDLLNSFKKAGEFL